VIPVVIVSLLQHSTTQAIYSYTTTLAALFINTAHMFLLLYYPAYNIAQTTVPIMYYKSAPHS
jgi:hypothetical protein